MQNGNKFDCSEVFPSCCGDLVLHVLHNRSTHIVVCNKEINWLSVAYCVVTVWCCTVEKYCYQSKKDFVPLLEFLVFVSIFSSSLLFFNTQVCKITSLLPCEQGFSVKGKH